jgi:hypothetical protein
VPPLDFTGWWVYVVGPLAGAIVAGGMIGLGRGLPGNDPERAPAEGDALPVSLRSVRRLGRPQRAGTIGRSPGPAAAPADSISAWASAPSSEMRSIKAMRM